MLYLIFLFQASSLVVPEMQQRLANLNQACEAEFTRTRQGISGRFDTNSIFRHMNILDVFILQINFFSPCFYFSIIYVYLFQNLL